MPGGAHMDPSVLTLLERLYRFGQDNDAQITERPKRMLNITSDPGRLLWILVRVAHAKRILEVGTSNGFSTIWLADAARSTGGRVTTLEVNPDKIVMARKNLAQAGVADLVDIREGRAAETLAALPGPFHVGFGRGGVDAVDDGRLVALGFRWYLLRAGAVHGGAAPASSGSRKAAAQGHRRRGRWVVPRNRC